jgi:hypothetical protein
MTASGHLVLRCQAGGYRSVVHWSMSAVTHPMTRLLTMPTGNDLEKRMGKKAYFNTALAECGV